jgi:5-methylcytosine-specific restriction endonuclease McrA
MGKRMLPRHSPKKRRKEKDVPRDVRRFVYERDKYQCVLCGTPHRIGLHHLIPREQFDIRFYNFKHGFHDVRNLVTICVVCHTRIHEKEEIMAYMLDYQIKRFGRVRRNEHG